MCFHTKGITSQSGALLLRQSGSISHCQIQRDLVAQFDVRPAEVRALFSGQLEPNRAPEIQNRMLTAGLPL